MGNINQKSRFSKESKKEAMIDFVIKSVRNNFFVSDFVLEDYSPAFASGNNRIKTKELERNIIKAFKKSLLFFSLDDEDIKYLIDNMEPLTFEKGETILEQGISISLISLSL
jgi:hypothetical protein